MRKSYIVAIGIAIATGLHAMGWITTDLFVSILGFLNGGAVATIRHAQATEATKVVETVVTGEVPQKSTG